MKLLVIPSTDWVGHPVPNRLNFIFDRLAEDHKVDVCHFKIFDAERRDTKCDLLEMDFEGGADIGHYYLKNLKNYGKKIARIGHRYDGIVSANVLPSWFANLQETPIIVDYLDHLPQSAGIYYDPPVDVLVKKVAGWFTSMNIKGAQAIITPTESFKEYLQKKTDAPVYVIPNGVDREVIRPVDPTGIEKRYSLGHPVLGYVGSLESWVDLESVIRSMPTVLKRYHSATLFIVGPGLHTDYAEKLRDMCRERELEKDVVFAGRIDHNDLASYVSAMDVGLNPRKSLPMNTMTMGSKVLNYLACGVPVLSKNMPVVEETLKGKGVHGYEEDEEFLGELAKSLSKDISPSVVEDHDWDRLAEKYEEVLYQVL